MSFTEQNSFRSSLLFFRVTFYCRPYLLLLSPWLIYVADMRRNVIRILREAPRPFSRLFFFPCVAATAKRCAWCRYTNIYTHCFWSRCQWATNVINLKGLIRRIMWPRSFQLILINTIINKEYNVLSIHRYILNSEYLASTTCIHYIKLIWNNQW